METVEVTASKRIDWVSVFILAAALAITAAPFSIGMVLEHFRGPAGVQGSFPANNFAANGAKHLAMVSE